MADHRTYRWLLISIAVVGFTRRPGQQVRRVPLALQQPVAGREATSCPTPSRARWCRGGSSSSRSSIPMRRSCDCGFDKLQTWSAPVMPRVNHGALFGMGGSKKGTANGFFAVVSAVAATAILVWGLRRSTAREKWLMVALGLILGGHRRQPLRPPRLQRRPRLPALLLRRVAGLQLRRLLPRRRREPPAPAGHLRHAAGRRESGFTRCAGESGQCKGLVLVPLLPHLQQVREVVAPDRAVHVPAPSPSTGSSPSCRGRPRCAPAPSTASRVLPSGAPSSLAMSWLYRTASGGSSSRARNPRDQRRQVEVVVRNVHREHAARRELLEVELERFARQQVDRDRVRAEAVEDDDVEVRRRAGARVAAGRRRAPRRTSRPRTSPRKRKYAGSRAIRTTAGSISKNVHCWPGFA